VLMGAVVAEVIVMGLMWFVVRPLRRWDRILAGLLLLFGIGWFIWSL